MFVFYKKHAVYDDNSKQKRENYIEVNVSGNIINILINMTETCKLEGQETMKEVFRKGKKQEKATTVDLKSA